MHVGGATDCCREPNFLLTALSAVRADHKYAHYSVPALRALKQGVPVLQQVVSFSEMAAIGFAYQHAKKFCDTHDLLDQMYKLPWADIAFVIRGCFFHDMIVEIPARNGDAITWRDVELRRADHEGKPLSRQYTFDSKHVFQLLDDMGQRP
jgi:hypothetical protein